MVCNLNSPAEKLGEKVQHKCKSACRKIPSIWRILRLSHDHEFKISFNLVCRFFPLQYVIDGFPLLDGSSLRQKRIIRFSSAFHIMNWSAMGAKKKRPGETKPPASHQKNAAYFLEEFKNKVIFMVLDARRWCNLRKKIWATCKKWLIMNPDSIIPYYLEKPHFSISARASLYIVYPILLAFSNTQDHPISRSDQDDILTF